MPNINNLQIFCDFDGTITKQDTLNKFLQIYADEKWLEIEQEWIDNKIGSLECTKKQMKLVPDISSKELDGFIRNIEMDEYFFEFYEFVKSNDLDFFIVSDGFDFFIEKILHKNKITDAKIFANKLTYNNGKFNVKFPYENTECKKKSGMCKCSIVKKYRNVNKSTLYIGDGLSDFCVSSIIDVLFAKSKLLNYSKERNHPNYLGFNTFGDIESFLKEIV